MSNIKLAIYNRYLKLNQIDLLEKLSGINFKNLLKGVGKSTNNSAQEAISSVSSQTEKRIREAVADVKHNREQLSRIVNNKSNVAKGNFDKVRKGPNENLSDSAFAQAARGFKPDTYNETIKQYKRQLSGSMEALNKARQQAAQETGRSAREFGVLPKATKG
jgi:hypothetical protein